MNKHPLIISHRRSGTHFLWETMKLNFELPKIKTASGFKHHGMPTKKNVEKLPAKHNCVYIVRDCRDVLIANYRYFSQKGTEPNLRGRYILQGKKLGAFIRGFSKAELHKVQIKFGYFVDPIDYWMKHVRWADHVYTVRFEDLKFSGEQVINGISNHFGWPLKHDEIRFIDKPVGMLPGSGLSGYWRDAFTKADLNYIYDKAIKTLYEFGYVNSIYRDAAEMRYHEMINMMTQLDRKLWSDWW